MIDLKKVREIVNEYLKIAIGKIVEKDLRIISAVRDRAFGETKEVWRITVRYKFRDGMCIWERNALFKIDAETWEVLEFNLEFKEEG